MFQKSNIKFLIFSGVNTGRLERTYTYTKKYKDTQTFSTKHDYFSKFCLKIFDYFTNSFYKCFTLKYIFEEELYTFNT